MPGIKSHHQGSQNNSKPEYIKWHCDGWKLLFLQANAVAFEKAIPIKRGKGRPKIYGKKLKSAKGI